MKTSTKVALMWIPDIDLFLDTFQELAIINKRRKLFMRYSFKEVEELLGIDKEAQNKMIFYLSKFSVISFIRSKNNMRFLIKINSLDKLKL